MNRIARKTMAITGAGRGLGPAILFILAQPRNTAIRQLVIERSRTEFLS